MDPATIAARSLSISVRSTPYTLSTPSSSSVPQRKWTWEMANGAAYNEIDFILISNMRTIANTSVLNRFNASRDHQLIQASIRTDRPQPRPATARRPMRVTFNRAIYNFALQTQLAADPCNEADANSLYAKLVDNINATTTIATFQEPQPTPLSDETLALLRQRREWKREAGRTSRAGRMRIEYVELCKMIRKKVKEDRRKHHIQIIEQAVQDGRLRHTRSELADRRRQIAALKQADGNVVGTTPDILLIIKQFYKDLYRKEMSSTNASGSHPGNDKEEDSVQPIFAAEVCHALHASKTGTAPGADGVTIDALQSGADSLAAILVHLFNLCLHQHSIPAGFADARMVLLYKKGDAKDIKNYCPISLLSTIYKTFTCI
uniref:Reverse transcriptase n=1 Tax=Plectus sambesii TaxID=2011161 RepID=A0A914XGD3_9BILA